MKYINRFWYILNLEDNTETPVWYRLLFLAALIAGFIYNFTSGSHMAGFGYGLGAGFGTIWATEEVVKLYRTYKKHREV